MNDNVSVLQVKLELGEELDEGGVCVSTGSFVMYNCARLATLFSHFELAVDKGQCSIYYTLYVYIPLNSVLHRAHIYILNISTCPAYYTREWEKQEKEMYISIFQLPSKTKSQGNRPCRTFVFCSNYTKFFNSHSPLSTIQCIYLYFVVLHRNHLNF